jgi:hypothetical protein
LQAACDAGTLVGRKSMATGAWSDNAYKARTDAIAMFDANFTAGAYGTKNLTRSYSEQGVGNVAGTASVEVPMSLMKVLGNESRTVKVECQAEMRIPNTDVMFVLDTTGSMNNAISGSGSNTSKIDGLKVAVKCFYEALAKENIDDITPSQCGETANPSGGNSANVQLRFGFVPYAVNVNVGKLLPLDFLADTWKYQSRVANFGTSAGYIATYGAPTGTITTSSNTTNNSGGDEDDWNEIGDDITIGGIFYESSYNLPNKKASCNFNAPPPPQPTNANGSPKFVSQSPSNPVYPAASVLRNYRTINTTGSVEYKYLKDGKKCELHSRWGASSTTTIMTQSTVPIIWQVNTVFVDWTYKQVEFDVSDLKNASANAWNNSVTLPIGSNGANADIAWQGCIEERKTVPLTASQDPFTAWKPIPAEALDMDIDTLPDSNDPDTLWGPLLPSAVWMREDNSGNKTLADRKTTSSQPDASGTNCPTAARFYQSWGPTAYKNYVNSLQTGGNTYHDIGLLWGGRLMSPTGIFADQTAPSDVTIQRHMVFMTDGDTQTSETNYSPYGVHWYDRRQTDPSSAPSTTLLENNVNARTEALCAAIKNRNITLWVVSYGGTGIDATTKARLQTCASAGHFLEANSVSQLATTFKGIAAEISNLRLTS